MRDNGDILVLAKELGTESHKKTPFLLCIAQIGQGGSPNLGNAQKKGCFFWDSFSNIDSSCGIIKCQC